MRNTRNWLVFLLCAMMLVNTLGITAMAAQSESPIALSFSNAADGNVQVQILATEAQTVADGKLVVTYDAEKLTYVNTEAWSDQVTLSVNPQSGKVILAFASADAAPVGTLFTLTFAAESYDTVVAIDGSSYITGVTAGLAQEISVCPSIQFTDLQRLSDEAHAAVDFMVAKGYMNGMTQTTFAPRTDLNRGMMVTILYRIAGKPEVEGAPAFTDVPTGKYFTDPVVWAAGNGITKGISAELFAPDKSLTRQELVTFLYRFAKYMDYDVTKTTDLSAYTDAGEVSKFAQEAFCWAVAEGIVNGTTDTTLSPTNSTNRAQICLMVSRLLAAQD